MKTETPINTVMSFYLEGHDNCVTIYHHQFKKLFHISLSTLLDIKHFSFWRDAGNQDRRKTVKQALQFYISKILRIEKIDLLIVNIPEGFKDNIPDSDSPIARSLNFILQLDVCKNSLIEYSPNTHHQRHAWCAYGQSGFDKCVVLSQDGEGDRESFNFYSFIDNNLTTIEKYIEMNGICYNAYSDIALALWNSKKEPHHIKNFKKIIKSKKIKERQIVTTRKRSELLDCAGKGMGMCAFEMPDREMEIKLRKNFRTIIPNPHEEKPKFGMTLYNINKIKPGIFDADEETQKSFAKQMMWVAQKEIENSTLATIENHKVDIQKHDNNLVLSGGVALNVLLNQKIKDRYPHFNVFVPPNPDDSGLSMGNMLQWMITNDIETDFEFIYSGMQIQNDFPIEDLLLMSSETSLEEISKLLSRGKILALFRGRSEIGPRALGNRSILADPKFADTKDKINKKVKFREIYRPFAPVCRKEDAPIYFESTDYENMEAMGYCPRVREEYRDVFPSVVHVDGTARLQTVTKDQSSLLYDLLTIHPTDVLLNTSFNVAGKPICNKMSTALDILDQTGLDHLVWEHKRKLYII